MTLEQTMDKFMEAKGQELNAKTFEEKVEFINRQWGHFSRWLVSEMGQYYDVVVTIQGGVCEDVEGLPEKWQWTLNDLDDDGAVDQN